MVAAPGERRDDGVKTGKMVQVFPTGITEVPFVGGKFVLLQVVVTL
jgi:hypothetical protein